MLLLIVGTYYKLFYLRSVITQRERFVELVAHVERCVPVSQSSGCWPPWSGMMPWMTLVGCKHSDWQHVKLRHCVPIQNNWWAFLVQKTGVQGAYRGAGGAEERKERCQLPTVLWLSRKRTGTRTKPRMRAQPTNIAQHHDQGTKLSKTAFLLSATQ